MERNHKSVEINGKWYIQLEYYRNYHSDWIKEIFTDWNGKKLQFLNKHDADQWIIARKNLF
jgi:heme-binding NEAT domain protein